MKNKSELDYSFPESFERIVDAGKYIHEETGDARCSIRGVAIESRTRTVGHVGHGMLHHSHGCTLSLVKGLHATGT